MRLILTTLLPPAMLTKCSIFAFSQKTIFIFQHIYLHVNALIMLEKSAP